MLFIGTQFSNPSTLSLSPSSLMLRSYYAVKLSSSFGNLVWPSYINLCLTCQDRHIRHFHDMARLVSLPVPPSFWILQSP